MYSKPKSAPPRMNSKRISTKNNAVKEMEAWINKDNDPITGNHETSRMSGQLTDNITEERMLKAKLWELSKERYKFIAQNSYEKKIFMDRMMRKSSALRRELAAKDDKGSRVTYSRISSTNSRKVLLERLDPTQQEDKWLGDASQAHKPFVTNGYMPAASAPADTRSTTDLTDSKFNLDAKILSSFSHDACNSSKLPPVVNVKHDRVVSASPTRSLPLVHRMRRRMTPLNCKDDPRYSELHHRLSPVLKRSTNVNIQSVVMKIESLHMEPKLPKDNRSRVDKQALAYIRKRGFVFP